MVSYDMPAEIQAIPVKIQGLGQLRISELNKQAVQRVKRCFSIIMN